MAYLIKPAARAIMQQRIISEDIRRQFKRNVTNVASLATEMAAFANSEGGLNDPDGWSRLLMRSALR